MQVFVVGGAVRDVLLDRDPKDIDFVVVGATPEQMIEKGFTRVGADFPVFLDERGQEFALARTERKVGSGHRGFETQFDPTVTLEDDLRRRDLTVNALAVEVENWEEFFMSGSEKFVIDPFGGIDDLRRANLRHVSDAFAEDPLRVLRVARFAARFSFRIHRDTLALMKSIVDSGELDHLTPERVWKEMERAIREPFPHLFFKTISDVGASHVLCDDSFTFAGLDHRLPKLVENNASEIQLWMSIFFDLDQDVVNGFIQKHKLPSEIAKAICFALEMCGAVVNSKSDKEWGADELMRICNKFRLWKDKLFLSDFRGMFEVLEPRDAGLMMSVSAAIHRASHIGFESLSPKERDNLKGPEIGDRIAEMRREVIVSALP